MTRYVAFLRAINVGGKNIILMKDLTSLFSSLGFTDVRTFLQTGNVCFTSGLKEQTLVEKIEVGIEKKFRLSVKVFVVSFSTLQKMIQENPFQNILDSADTKKYVTFFSGTILTLPSFSPNKDVEILSRQKGIVFSLSHTVKGKSGFPNAFIEKQGKVFSTTRDWKTVQKLLLI